MTGSDDDNPALGRDWFPSPWGADDQRGNANLLGPHKVLEALALVRFGETIPLGFPYTPRMPFSPGRSFTLTLQGGPEGTGGPVGAKSRTVWNDDFVATEIGQMGTHMDALGHLGHQRLMGCGHCRTLLYNGNRLDEIWTPSGLSRLGIEQAPIFVTRGVLLDVEGLKGAPLARGVEITPDDLRACLDRQGLPADGWLRPGDVVLIRTGHGSRFETEAETWYDSAPGLGLPAAEYLSAFRPCVVGADNFAVDVMPPVDPDFVLPCHQHLIIRHGIHLHEGMNLAALAARGISEFVYVFAPLPIVGATGSPGMPFAIV
ncbi:cyclase family protein [Segnochrobactrum spirostomi]|uniref:cyclase family protein n=1 Tax=Segnochrobactrum spirostomi TaxID=2608987 RepID=UPI001AD7E6BE|nr:cyclase family protein [Segnochrobactrum spirostomi]